MIFLKGRGRGVGGREGKKSRFRSFQVSGEVSKGNIIVSRPFFIRNDKSETSWTPQFPLVQNAYLDKAEACLTARTQNGF